MGTLTRVLIATLLAASAFAQVRETTTVEVVNVPVYVTANNAPVTSLTRDNFELYVNGKRQPIDYFDVIDYATLSPEQHDVRQRRLYMLVFDELSPPNALYRARNAALQFIDKAAPNETIGIATMDLRGLKIVVPFTRDHLAVERGVRELNLTNVNDPLHLAVGADMPPVSRGKLRDPMGDASLFDPELTATEIVDNEIANLADLADRLSGMEGQKHVVLLSAGFSSSTVHGIHDRPLDDIRRGPIRGMGDLDRGLYGRGAPAMNTVLVEHLNGLHAAYSAAGVFLDAIDIAGLRPFQSTLSNDSLYMLVRDTGGELIDHRNDLNSALQLLTDTHRVVYSLGFSAHDTGKLENKISLKLVNVPRGTQALYRRSFQLGAGQGDTGDMLRLADIIQNDIEQNGVTTNVIATNAGKGADVEITLPGRELLAHASGGFVGAKVMIYVMSGASVVTFRIKRLDIDLSRAETALENTPVRVRDTFELPPGHYAAKVVVRMDTTGALGFGRADVTVGAQ
ncbi:MAG TPA: VWA domain-containing protein [Thermoanaerobaculia bacterium]|nr:VWA domain-containing protein [Thermoanaerobaculia bacterium]